jgi:hypothetical protein
MIIKNVKFKTNMFNFIIKKFINILPKFFILNHISKSKGKYKFLFILKNLKSV